MEPVMAVSIGLMYAAAIFLMLRRSIVKLVIGLMLLSNAANLLIFTSAGMTRGAPPLIPEGSPPCWGGRRPAAPGRGADRHRDRLRRAGLRRGADSPCLRDRQGR